jgi:hypothetical protein
MPPTSSPPIAVTAKTRRIEVARVADRGAGDDGGGDGSTRVGRRSIAAIAFAMSRVCSVGGDVNKSSMTVMRATTLNPRDEGSVRMAAAIGLLPR